MEVAKWMNHFRSTMGTAYKELFKLYDLIQNGETRSVHSFLQETRVDVNAIIPCKGIGVLHLAVGVDPEEKSKECTEILLKHGANPNLCNEDGVTPVHIAAIWGRADNLRLLCACGGDPALQDFDGLSAFEYAAREQQWDVYDYLRNVLDENDSSTDLQCAYTLDLDKILVTTDQIVAEYEPLTEEPTNTTARKSKLVRDWCDTNSLVINKLYPTILSETYIVDDESVAWNDRNITLDLTKLSKETYDLTNKSSKITDDLSRQSHITDHSFKTCLSNKSVNVSGVKPLDITDVKNPCCLKRKSVYDNFSLPGSPKDISHRNYNTKSSLRCKSQKCGLTTNADSLCSELQKLSLESSCSSFDKAVAVVQNRTNERLCLDGNTRRSSASSGVSSNYSAGSILVASVHEEYKYEDKEEDVVLIERRMLLQPVVLPIDEACDGSPDQTAVSIASSLPTALRYSDRELRAELLRLGYTPGPIQDTTRTLYLRKLCELKKIPTPVRQEKKNTFSIEMEKSLRSAEWMERLGPYEELERKARLDFANPARQWREGKCKTSFTYLLLDPRLTENLPANTRKSKLEMWTTFVNSIFYVGKGKRSRPYAHLYQALTLWKRGFTTSNDNKIQHILNIWHDKVGVVCLHIFLNVIPAEAFTYEAAMIDVIGISNLKNKVNGTYYGLPATWPHKERRMLGLYLLYKAMGIFVHEGERQLRPDDI